MLRFSVTVLACWLTSLAGAEEPDEVARQWHQWRGPLATGVAPHADPPIEWGEGKNIAWQAEIPGEGSATPIIWADRIFVQTAIETDRPAPEPARKDARQKTQIPNRLYQFIVLCLDRKTGKTLWQRTAIEAAPHEGRHTTNSYASASPITDGRRVFASFGSRGVFAYTVDGEPLWQRDLGDMRTRYGWGEAASPALHGESLVVNWDHEDDSFLTALDAASGATRWKADRTEPTSWATPLVVNHKGRTQIVVNGTNRARGYDFETGKVIWECGGQTVNAIPSPVAAFGLAICMSGYGQFASYAIPLGSTGDLTDSKAFAWKHLEGTPYVPSPLLVGDRLYFTRGNTPLVSCLEIKTGTALLDRVRVRGFEGQVYASPVSAAGRMYFTTRDGVTVVARHDKEIEVLAVNRIGEPVDASIALVGRELFLRGKTKLYCIREATNPAQ